MNWRLTSAQQTTDGESACLMLYAPLPRSAVVALRPYNRKPPSHFRISRVQHITVLEWLIAKFRCSLLFHKVMLSKVMLSESENCSIIIIIMIDFVDFEAYTLCIT